MIAWLLTYALHSTLLLGLAWVITRRAVQSHGARDLIWKTAIIGGLVSSTVQVVGGFEPVAGRFSLQAASDITQWSTPPAAGQPPASRTVPDQLDEPAAASPAPAPTLQAPPSTSSWSFPRLNPTTLVLGVWVAVGAFLAIQFLIGQFLLVIRVGRRALVRDEQLLEVVDLLREEAGIRRHVRLTRAEGIPSPVALGMSEICIPDAALTELDREQQESMLAHELAHIARRDPAWLVAVCLIERVFFFQPLNRLARRRVQEAAEYICDDWAVRRAGSGLTLAKCLVKVAEWIDTTPEPIPVSGMAEMRSHFVSRIHRLIANHALSTQPTRRWLVPVAMGAVVLVVAAAPGVTATRPPMLADVSSNERSLALVQPVDSTEVISPEERDMQTRTRTNTNANTNTNTNNNNNNNTNTTTSTSTSTSTRTTTEIDYSNMTFNSAKEVRALATVQDTAAVTALIAALKDEDPEVRRAAAQALGNRRDPRAVQPLIAALSDKDAEVRQHVLEALSNMRDPRAVEGFIMALKDEDPDVRREAAQAIGNLPETRRGYSPEAQRASTALSTLLTDVSAAVRRAAIQALREVKGARPTDAIITALKDADAEVRQSAAEALGDMEVRGASTQLVVLLSDPNADVRHAAAHALGHLKDPTTAEALAKALKDPNQDVRQAAAESLGEMELATAPQALLDAMKDENPDVRHSAVDAIGNIRDPRAVPALAALLNDTDSDVREAAVDGLSEIRDAAAMDALVKAMSSKDPVVRRRAAEALGERN